MSRPDNVAWRASPGELAGDCCATKQEHGWHSESLVGQFPSKVSRNNGKDAMYHCGRHSKGRVPEFALLLFIALLQLVPFSAYGAEQPEGLPPVSQPPRVEEPGRSDLPPAIKELCEAMRFSDFARWYRLLSDESREGRTEEEFVAQHQMLLEQTITWLERGFNVPFVVRTEVTLGNYPKFYIGRFEIIYFSPHSFEQGRVLYETEADIAFELEPDGRVTTKFGGYGDTGWTNKLTIQPPGGL